MSAVNILSHPDKQLSEHVSNVLEVGELILNDVYFGEVLPCRRVFELLARLHDTGKSSAAFQAYIKDPESYRGNRDKKAHTPLSLFFAGGVLENIGVEPNYAFAVFQCVAGHHRGLFTFDELVSGYVYDSGKCRMVSEQISSVNIGEIFKEVGLNNSLEGKTCNDMGHALLKFVEDFEDYIKGLSMERKISYRLAVHYLFSVLVEADRAYLAVSEEKYKEASLKLTTKYSKTRVTSFVGKLSFTPLDKWRNRASQEVLTHAASGSTGGVYTLTLPTGMGKTLTSLIWALQKQGGEKLVVVLPFLSIIDQTEEIYKKIFPDKKSIIPYHSLSSPEPDTELDDNSAEFFWDTWSANIVITTYDQFLLALFSPKTRHLIRFHNLCGATILIDEIQTLPCKLWKPVSHVLESLSKETTSTILAMSATQPGFFKGALELISNTEQYFNLFDRYTVSLCLSEISINEFERHLEARILELEERFKEKYKLLLTFNTRASARRVRKFIEKLPALECTAKYFLSSDVTPQDRLNAIGEIKNIGSAVVVSTQCVEAGVDIDMNEVWRDFGPLDSIVQIAGRCNRNGNLLEGKVKIFSIKNENGKNYANMVYRDGIRLERTREVLKGLTEIREMDVPKLCEKYFHLLEEGVNQGHDLIKNFANWEEYEDVHEILRGKTEKQFQFLVVGQCSGIDENINNLAEIEDHWQRRRKFRQLAGDIARITVSVYAKRGFDPYEIADKGPDIFDFWYLKPMYYSPKYGLELPEEKECYVW